MSAVQERSVLEQLAVLSTMDATAAPNAIPLHDYSLLLELITEAVKQVEQYDLSDALIALDPHTAAQVEGMDALLQRVKTVAFLGPATGKWASAPHVASYPAADGALHQQHLFLISGKSCNIAILGLWKPWAGQETPVYAGCWTFHRPYLDELLQQNFPAQAKAHVARGDDSTAPNYQIISAIMRCQASVLEVFQRDMAMDKNDLFSILNILKAISAKRRAHDVLFVFVEQIARVISAERCSIVRVWGSEKTGQVLASHEDSTVNHREIILDKYPELRAALATHEKIVISDVSTHPLTEGFAPVLEAAHIHALLVIPIVLFDETIGSLFLRAARSTGAFSVREIGFFEVVAEAAANALERAHLFESIQIANERLERLAVTDGLTGLYNHRYCRDRLEEEFERASRYKLPLSCLIFDVDNFKSFNDTYGHLLGDSILREIAERTIVCIRKSDLVARYGGEEFVVIMPQTEHEGAVAEAERLRSAIASKPFRDVPDGVQVTASVGVGTLEHGVMQSYDDIIRAADMALYDAKRAGKNRVAAFQGSMKPIAVVKTESGPEPEKIKDFSS